MKARSLVYCILLSTFVILLLSTATQATEYRENNTEVNASEILTHIENGEYINITNCHIVGELNVSNVKLKTVPKLENPDHMYFIDNEEWEIYDSGVNEELKVVESNISIHDSLFENNIDFSNVKFNNTVVSFSRTNFTGSVNFNEVNFAGYADFKSVNFRGPVYFKLANFTDDSYFDFAIFSGPVYFKGAKFNNYSLFAGATFFDSVHFNSVNFNGSSDFRNAKFKHSTYFNYAVFNSSSNFWIAEFKDFAYFNGADFKSSVNFEGCQVESIITSEGDTCQKIMIFFENRGDYNGADIIYYNYRTACQAQKSRYDISKWMDIIAWVTCGYGVRISHTLYFSGFLILFFSKKYAGRLDITFTTGNKKIPLRFHFSEPGIIIRFPENSENQYHETSFRDALYFSMNTFTTVGYGNWYPKENFKKWATLEGLLGWIMLGIFMATLTNVMIRS